MNICHKTLTSTTVVSFFPAEMSSPAYVNNGKSRDFLLLLNMDKIGMGVLPQVGAVPHVTLLINTLEASDKQVVDLATEDLYSQQVEMVLYFQLLIFCFRGTSLL